jgi:very-short-patch-repair endonuclease
MRSQPTPPERALWRALSAGKLDGLKFRRQSVIDGFIVDFYSAEAGLVIELDGQTHTDPARDAKRDTMLFERHGLKVLRFSNQHLGEDMDGVLRAILAVARGAPSPNPSLQGRGDVSAPLPLREGSGEGSLDMPKP